MARVVAARERSPALISHEQVLGLERQLAATEDRIAAAPRFDTTRVEADNRPREAFPSGWVAGRHGFEPAASYDA